MIREIQLRSCAREHKNDDAKLAIIRDYMENNLSAEEVVVKYRLNNKYLFYQWVGQYVGKSLSLPEPKETDLDMKKRKTALMFCPTKLKTCGSRVWKKPWKWRNSVPEASS